jgi:hypothetical protein
VRAAIAVVLRQKGCVSVVDVLVEMERLTPAQAPGSPDADR